MKVLSLFDGMSCGQIALERANIKVDTYFASEINKWPMQITQKNYPNTVQMGNITKIAVGGLPKIDLLIGGSPCQGFSFAGKQLNFQDSRSALFFKYVRILRELKPKYFLLENVKMKREYQQVISDYLGVLPIKINSALVSGQNRERLYWTNIPNVHQPVDKKIFLADVLEGQVEGKYYLSEKFINGILNSTPPFRDRFLPYTEGDVKGRCLLERYYKMGKTNQYIMQINPCKKAGGKQPRMQDRVYYTEKHKSPALTSFCNRLNILTPDSFRIRRLTPLECERLQTVPEGYTEGVSDTQRYSMLGNGWTIDIIAHILKNINQGAECFI